MPIVFATNQSIISEPTSALSSMNLLL